MPAGVLRPGADGSGLRHGPAPRMEDNQTPIQVAASVLTRLEPILGTERPDWVLVQEDTTTVAAASLAAFYARVKVGHVEAGLPHLGQVAAFPGRGQPPGGHQHRRPALRAHRALPPEPAAGRRARGPYPGHRQPGDRRAPMGCPPPADSRSGRAASTCRNRGCSREAWNRRVGGLAPMRRLPDSPSPVRDRAPPGELRRTVPGDLRGPAGDRGTLWRPCAHPLRRAPEPQCPGASAPVAGRCGKRHPDPAPGLSGHGASAPTPT